jgi:Cu/Ag efflux protein CusF
MRLYKVVILANLAFGLGLLSGSLWWERDVDRLSRELATARQSNPASPAGERSWSVMGIVRAVRSNDRVMVITHEPISGLMGSMTMAFRVSDGALMKGIEPGDRVQFTLLAADRELLVVGLRKEGSR